MLMLATAYAGVLLQGSVRRQTANVKQIACESNKNALLATSQWDVAVQIMKINLNFSVISKCAVKIIGLV